MCYPGPLVLKEYYTNELMALKASKAAIKTLETQMSLRG